MNRYFSRLLRIKGRLVPRFILLTKPYLLSEKRRSAWGLLVLLVILMLADTTASVLLNQQSGEFSSALADRDSPRYWKSIYLSVVLLVLAVPIYGFYYYVRDRLTLHWRSWMTNRYVSQYFRDRTYYNLTYSTHIDNPDQRLTDDINSFTGKSIYFLLIFIETGLQIVAFSGVLWFISHSLVWFLLVYALAGTMLTTVVFGRPLVGLNFFQLRNEADFRFSLIRVRENAESIAFYRGEERESRYALDRFDDVVGNSRRLINWQFFLNIFQFAYSSATLIIPGIILAPRVMSGELEIGAVVSATGAFVKVFGALNIVVTKFDQLSYFTAGVGRLDRFARSLKLRDEQDDQPPNDTLPQIITKPDQEIAFEGVTVQTPDGKRILVKDLTIELASGERLLIAGASGGGKSSLLRVFAGLWLVGRGTVSRPNLDDMLFLPQKPYMVIGSLRDQLLYPMSDSRISDDSLQKALATVRLPKLVERCGGLDITSDWGKVLSLGEQQRLAIARAILSERPYLVLDEATSALDEDNEAEIYRILVDSGTTLISISHRPQVARFHTQVLVLDGEEGWKIVEPETYLSEHNKASG